MRVDFKKHDSTVVYERILHNHSSICRLKEERHAYVSRRKMWLDNVDGRLRTFTRGKARHNHNRIRVRVRAPNGRPTTYMKQKVTK